jgi:sugar lactone lactonase YvrE
MESTCTPHRETRLAVPTSRRERDDLIFLRKDVDVNKRVRTVAGTGRDGFSGDSGPATKAELSEPFGVIVGPDGAVYFCDLGNHRIRRIEPDDGAVTTVAGSGECGYSGDGGSALAAALNQPYEIRFDPNGHLVFVDMAAHVVRRVDRDTGIIETLAGTGEAGFSGDGAPARAARFDQPHSIEFDADGGLYVCDIRNHRIRRIDPETKMIETYAGTGEPAPTPDGSAREGTPLHGPRAMAFNAHGDLFLALREGNVVLRLDHDTQTYARIAGSGERGYTGDGGEAREATLSGPKGISLENDRAVIIADTESHTIRRIDLANGTIDTVLGRGEATDGPDGDPLRCGLARPHGVFVDSHSRVYVGDSENHRVRVLEDD